MRMRERSSVERIRMALTEKRDMLGDIIAVEREEFSKEKRRREERRRERRGEESMGEDVSVLQPKSRKLGLCRFVRVERALI